MNPFLGKKIKNILVIRKQAIGDVLMTTPFLEVLRKNMPQAKITYLTNQWSETAVKNNPNLDQVLVYRNDEFFNFLKFWQHPFKKIKHILEVKSKGFDALFVLQSPSLFWGIFGIFIGARIRAGLSTGRPDFLTHRVLIQRRATPLQKYVYDGRHKVEWNLDLLKAVGIKDRDNQGEYLNISKQDKERINKFWRENLLQNQIVLAVACGGGTNPKMKQYCKRWPKERWVYFLRLLNHLQINGEKKALSVILIGGKSDKEIIEFIKAQTKNKLSYQLIDAGGKFSLPESAELIRRSRLFIGTDGGPMHLANCVKTPLLVIFGPTDPLVYGPYAVSAQVIDKKLPCGYCYKEECWHLLCMRKVSPQEVFREVEKRINAT